jgi:N-acetylmuramoyl-L-alanine amidase
MLIFHYTGMDGCEEARERLCDAAAKVSAHYLIDEDGTTYALVPEARRAWHAGAAAWRGHSDVNGRSIGIELVNAGPEHGYLPFPERQMEALRDLAQGILSRHPIPPRNVIGHSDVAPTRKIDPGALFDWPGLAALGIGLWPGPGDAPVEAMDDDAFAAALADYGYDTTDLAAAITAFQRHFRPQRMDGIIDAETGARLHGLMQRIS